MSVPGDPSRCAFTQYGARAACTVALDRHPEPHLLRERLRRVDLLDADDAITVADVVERLGEPIGVEYGVECRGNRRLHGAARYRRDARRRLAFAASDRTEADDAPSTGVDMVEERARGHARGVARPRGRRRPRGVVLRQGAR